MQFTPEHLEVFNRLRDHVAENAKNKGFKNPPKGIPAEIWFSRPLDIIRAAVYMANMVGEVAEFWEAARKGKLHEPCDKAEGMTAKGLPTLTCAEEEIADMIIRALDNAAEFGVDVAKAVAVKAAYNTSRPYQHGGRQA